MSNLTDSFFVSFTHPIANGFAPPILGRDIGITFEEIERALDTAMQGRKIGLTTTPIDEQNIASCMSKLKLLNPIQNKGQKRTLEEEAMEGGGQKRMFETEELELGGDDVMQETDDLLAGR
jgi:hypothetical protein